MKKSTSACPECGRKKTVRSADYKKTLTSRLNRIAGQTGGVRKMMLADRYCEDVLVQLSAIRSAAKGMSDVLLERHFTNCISPRIGADDEGAVKEILGLLRLKKTGGELASLAGSDKRAADYKTNLIAGLDAILDSVEDVRAMVNEDAYCEDILIELNGIRLAVDDLCEYVLENHLQNDVAPLIKAGDENAVKEFLTMYKRYRH